MTGHHSIRAGASHRWPSTEISSGCSNPRSEPSSAWGYSNRPQRCDVPGTCPSRMSCDAGGSPVGILPSAMAPACRASSSVANEFVCALIPEQAAASNAIEIARSETPINSQPSRSRCDRTETSPFCVLLWLEMERDCEGCELILAPVLKPALTTPLLTTS